MMTGFDVIPAGQYHKLLKFRTSRFGTSPRAFKVSQGVLQMVDDPGVLA
jgi:hypothetical protein